MLDVDLALPGDKHLRVPAFGVVFHTDPKDPDTAAPGGAVVNRRVPDLAAAHAALLADADAVGLPSEQIERWWSDAGGSRAVAPRTVGPVQVGHVRVDAEIRPSDASDEVLINYHLDWK
jgi:hypothetical protein